MDPVSHALWAAVGAKGVNIKFKKKISVKWTAFWGAFPDILAFGIPLVGTGWLFLIGRLSWAQMPWLKAPDDPGLYATPFVENLFTFTPFLYSLTHSLVIFTLVFLIGWFLFKRPVWVLGGWFLHILMDMPTHEPGVHATRVFWPISDWTLPFGVSWLEGWFMMLNYGVLLIIFIYLYRRHYQQTKEVKTLESPVSES